MIDKPHVFRDLRCKVMRRNHLGPWIGVLHGFRNSSRSEKLFLALLLTIARTTSIFQSKNPEFFANAKLPCASNLSAAFHYTAQITCKYLCRFVKNDQFYITFQSKARLLKSIYFNLRIPPLDWNHHSSCIFISSAVKI